MKNRKKVLVIMGHPGLKSLTKSIADSYIKGARKNYEVRSIYLSRLKFDPILHEGYNKIQKLEPDLIKAQKDIKWAEHIVFVYPLWWGMLPALLKGFLDRTLLPGYAFKYDKKGKLSKFLKGKTGSLIITAGGPKFMYFFAGWIINIPMNVAVLKFCGIKPKKQTFFTKVKRLSKEESEKIFEKAKILGEKGI